MPCWQKTDNRVLFTGDDGYHSTTFVLEAKVAAGTMA